jgi:hypothetical protein
MILEIYNLTDEHNGKWQHMYVYFRKQYSHQSIF